MGYFAGVMENFAAYAHLISRVDRSAVLDIGSAFTKCGFGGKPSPRYILPSRFVTTQGKEISLRSATKANEQEWREALEIFLREIFLTRMGIGKGYKITVLDSLIHPVPFRRALLHVLLNRFRFSSVKYIIAECAGLFAIPPKTNASPLSLYQTGLIVDIGSLDTRVLPVYDGIAMTGKLQQGGASSFDVLQRLRALLLEYGVVQSPSGEQNPVTSNLLSNSVVEDILSKISFACSGKYCPKVPLQLKFPPSVSTCFNLDQAQGAGEVENKSETTDSSVVDGENKRIPSASFPLSDGRTIEICGFIRGHSIDVLFENTEDYPSVAAKILDCLLACEIDMRSELAFSIIMTGGICSIPGLIARLTEECERLIKTPKYSAVSALAGKLNFYSTPFNYTTIPWVGGSIISSLQDPGVSVSLEQFQEQSFACLPNWSSKVLL